LQGDFEIPGRPRGSPGTATTHIGLIGGEYFGVLRVPLLTGRMISPSEMARSQRVGVINEEMARMYWPGGNPLGARIRIPFLDLKGHPEVLKPPDSDQPVEIVGVVATVRNHGLTDPSDPAIYVPWTLLSPPGAIYLVRTSGDPHNIVNAVREQVRAEDPDQPLFQIQTLDEWMRNQTAYPRFSTTLFRSSPVWRCCSPRLVFTALCLTWWRGALTSSASASLSELAPPTCCAWWQG